MSIIVQISPSLCPVLIIFNACNSIQILVNSHSKTIKVSETLVSYHTFEVLLFYIRGCKIITSNGFAFWLGWRTHAITVWTFSVPFLFCLSRGYLLIDYNPILCWKINYLSYSQSNSLLTNNHELFSITVHNLNFFRPELSFYYFRQDL